MICVFIIWREHPKAHRKWFYVGFFMVLWRSPGLQGIALIHYTTGAIHYTTYLWRFLPQELIWINPKAGCAPVFCYDTLFILRLVNQGPLFPTHKSGSLRGPTANTKWQQTACQYITPRLCVRARVNIAQPQSPGANAPVLKSYVKYLLLFKEV